MKRFFILFLFLFVVLFFSSCSNSSSSNPKTKYVEITIGRENLRAICDGGWIGTAALWLQDSNFHYANEEWITTDFTPALNDFQIKNNLWVYKSELNDCEDFSDWGRLVAKDLAYKQGKKTPLAVGKGIYKKDSGLYHAIIVFIVGNDLMNSKIIFYEPQQRGIIKLSNKERENMEFAEF